MNELSPSSIESAFGRLDRAFIDGKYVAAATGAIGAVIPWNFPFYLATCKLGPALASGNSVVLKPADQTPTRQIALDAF